MTRPEPRRHIFFDPLVRTATTATSRSAGPRDRLRAARLLALALLLALAVPPPLLAHQYLRASAPADGAQLDAVPAEVRLTFSEPVRLDFTDVAIQGPDGLLVLGPGAQDQEDPRVLVVPVEGGWHAGEFVVRWTTVGADGHRTSGSVSFTVATDAAGLPEPEPDPAVDPDPAAAAPDAPAADLRTPHHDPRLFPETPAFGPESPAYVAIRAVLFSALVALIGVVALRLTVFPAVRRRWPDRGGWLVGGIDRGGARLGLVASALLILAALARLWAQSASLFGTDGALARDRLAQALSLEPWATGWWLQVTAAVLALVGFALVPRVPVAGWAVAALAATAAAITPALSGHAVALSDLSWFAVPVDAVHVLAAGGWIGGLLALVVVGLPTALGLSPERRGPAASALVQSFSPAALAFTAALLVTGVVSAWLHLGDVQALWTSAYGRTLLLKVAIFSAVALLGAYNFLRLRPTVESEDGSRRLRRSGAVELVLALAVIAVTAVLVAIPPPAD